MSNDDKKKLATLAALENVLCNAVYGALNDFIKSACIAIGDDEGVTLATLEEIHVAAINAVNKVTVFKVHQFKNALSKDVCDRHASEASARIMVEVLDRLNRVELAETLGNEQADLILQRMTERALARLTQGGANVATKSPIDLSGSSSFSAVMDEIKRKTH